MGCSKRVFKYGCCILCWRHVYVQNDVTAMNILIINHHSVFLSESHHWFLISSKIKINSLRPLTSDAFFKKDACDTRILLVTNICRDCNFDVKLTLLVLKIKYSRMIKSILWLLMPWLLALPGHQQSWYRWSRTIDHEGGFELLVLSISCEVIKNTNFFFCIFEWIQHGKGKCLAMI